MTSCTFSPLFIGVISATPSPRSCYPRYTTFSPLFIGVISATEQSSPLRSTYNRTFSPLFIGVISATEKRGKTFMLLEIFQSPFHRGN